MDIRGERFNLQTNLALPLPFSGLISTYDVCTKFKVTKSWGMGDMMSITGYDVSSVGCWLLHFCDISPL